VKIAVVAPLISRIDDAQVQVGGAQAIVADLSAGLARRSHRVTLLAAGGSRVTGVDTVDLGLDVSRFTPAILDMAALRRDEVAQREGFGRIRSWLDAHRDSWDVVHAHAYDAPAFDALAGLAPVVHTLHLAPIDRTVVAAASAAARAGALLASVSRANARAWTAAGAPTTEVLPNGIDVDGVPFVPRGGTSLLFAGRMSPEKAPEVAVRAALRAGREILLAGPVYDDAYFARAVRPLLGPRVRYASAVHRPELHRLMGASLALVMPVRWEEPFGLVAVEAQAAGTPVIAFARGGLPEIVVDGVTGTLAPPDDEDALVAGIVAAHTLDRAACRRNAMRWTTSAMIDAHERLYRRLVSRRS
jgi:glycosyltransferase involved in cell wall biosynthesis